MQELPPARIVFEVALEGTARKLVTIRSALLITNKLPENIELKLETQMPIELGNVYLKNLINRLSTMTVIMSTRDTSHTDHGRHYNLYCL